MGRWFKSSRGETFFLINNNEFKNIMMLFNKCNLGLNKIILKSFTEGVELIKENVNAEIYPRSVDLNSSSISNNHPIVKAVNEIGIPVYGSPTLSDQTKLSCPSIKIGPGDSSRSHTADEFIYIEEIEKGCEIMKKLIKKLLI